MSSGPRGPSAGASAKLVEEPAGSPNVSVEDSNSFDQPSVGGDDDDTAMRLGDGDDGVVALTGRVYDLDAVGVALVSALARSALEHEHHGWLQPPFAHASTHVLGDSSCSTGPVSPPASRPRPDHIGGIDDEHRRHRRTVRAEYPARVHGWPGVGNFSEKMSRTRRLLRLRGTRSAGPALHKEDTMAKYLLLKHYRGAPAPDNDVPMDQWTPDEIEAHCRFMSDFSARLQSSGEFIDGQALSPDGVWVRHDGEGCPPVTDGPFAETKDLIAGWMVIDVDSYERAIELAGELSAAPGAGGEPIHEWLEVRPFLAAPPTVTE